MTSAELLAVAKKNPITVVCGVLSLALALGIYFRSGSIPEANTELDQKAALARRYALNISNSSQLKEQFEAMANANKAIEARLIRPSELGINQQYFYKLEGDTGVKLLELNQNMRPAAAVKNSTLVPVVFFVTAQGDFSQVMTFLRAVENGTHFSRIVSASCSGNRKGPVNLSLTVELLGRP